MKLISSKITGLLTAGVLMAAVAPTFASFWYDQAGFETQMLPDPEGVVYRYTVDQYSVDADLDGKPTGVGGFFTFADAAPHTISIILNLGGTISTVESELVTSGSFFGYTTDRFPNVAYVTGFSFPSATIDSLHVGFDIPEDPSDPPVVPEPTTTIAAALLLLPFGISMLRIVRRKSAV